jgi:hypothetical protein
VRERRVLLLGLTLVLALAGMTAAFALAGCAGQFDAATVSDVDGRADLTVWSYPAHVHAGLSDPVAITVPDGVASVLIEIAGAEGAFRLAQLETPSGRDVVESGGFVTRDAREVDGLVDWLYPNSPSLTLEPGRHVLRFTAFDGSGRTVDDEDVAVRLYTRTGAGAGGSVKVDLFVADGAAAGDLDALAADLIGRIGALYAQAGLSVGDYTVAPLPMVGGASLSLDGGRLGAPALGRLSAAMRAAGARADALHLVVVRTLDDSGGSVAGYSLALPGPFALERPTAAVLVSTAPFVGSDGTIDTGGLAVTCAHEMGHYLGLYHTSERDGRVHDPIADTPECNGDSDCADASNVMFWTGGATRSKLTAGQGAVMRLHPLVAAAPPPPLPVARCGAECLAGDTCVILAGESVCATACDPASLPCMSGRCAPSDDGTYVCRAD